MEGGEPPLFSCTLRRKGSRKGQWMNGLNRIVAIEPCRAARITGGQYGELFVAVTTRTQPASTTTAPSSRRWLPAAWLSVIGSPRLGPGLVELRRLLPTRQSSRHPVAAREPARRLLRPPVSQRRHPDRSSAR